MVETIGRLLRRPVVAGLALLLVYVALSFAMDTHGYLGTDTGGKVSALEQMDRTGSFDPDIGYWAKQWDPDARFHPEYNTVLVGTKYVNATSLPALVAAEPLYRVGGYRLALLLPMLGSVAAAFACRAIAERVRAGSGWWAFWIAGLASPLTIYALDFWEHSIGVALMCWGVVLVIDAVERGPTPVRGALAGLLFGVAFSMRTEALVYAAVALALACVVSLVIKRKLWPPVWFGAAALAGLGVAYAANIALEKAVYGTTFRGGRATGEVQGAGSQVATRVREAFITAVSLRPDDQWRTILVGVVAVALLALAVWIGRRGVPADQQRVVVGLLAVVGVLYLLRAATDGLGFVPGFLVAAPFAVVGAVTAWGSRPGRIVLAVAGVALPLVWAFQYTGGAVPQWGGRYVLTSSLLLVAVGAAAIHVVDRRIVAFVAVLSVAVTTMGVAWLGYRSRQIDTVGRDLLARPEPALISELGFFLREVGPRSLDPHWLSAGTPDDVPGAVDIVAQAGIPEFGLLVQGADPKLPSFPGWQVQGERQYDWLGLPFTVATYDRSP